MKKKINLDTWYIKIWETYSYWINIGKTNPMYDKYKFANKTIKARELNKY